MVGKMIFVGRKINSVAAEFPCVRETRPRAILAENVKGSCSGPSFKPYYDYILRELAAPFRGAR